jgi:hypothetical protein
MSGKIELIVKTVTEKVLCIVTNVKIEMIAEGVVVHEKRLQTKRLAEKPSSDTSIL